jgi:hypothetical protein
MLDDGQNAAGSPPQRNTEAGQVNLTAALNDCSRTRGKKIVYFSIQRLKSRPICILHGCFNRMRFPLSRD